MPKVSVQFCNFSDSVPLERDGATSWRPAHMLPVSLGARVEVDVTSAPTADGDRPSNSAGQAYTHAICIPLEGQVLVEVGADPSAGQSSRLLALSGLEYAVHVPTGHKLSFVTRG